MPKQSSIQYTQKQIQQLSELEQAGYGNWTHIIRLALEAFYDRYLSRQEITILSKKAAEIPASPEVVSIDGKPWLNLGSGLLADAAAQMISVQFPAIETRQSAGEWFVYEPVLAQDYYTSLRVIIIFKVM